MTEYIEQKKKLFEDVLTQAYADMIHADHYAKDAMETVRLAQAFFGAEK